MINFNTLSFALALLTIFPAHAINAKYAQQLENSGCTQVTENQGCNIHKTKAENAAAGFGSESAGAISASPYAGNWIATFPETGATVAHIHINSREEVWVNNKKLKTKKSDGALIFKDGHVTYTLQGDRRIKGEDIWVDSDAGTKGPINAQ
ncbi:hypothetical protein ACXEGV_004659 [Klebsiella quasipneumoniae]